MTRKRCLPRRGVGLWEVRNVVIVSGQLVVGFTSAVRTSDKETTLGTSKSLW